jgi:hypothetical protein
VPYSSTGRAVDFRTEHIIPDVLCKDNFCSIF